MNADNFDVNQVEQVQNFGPTASIIQKYADVVTGALFRVSISTDGDLKKVVST